MKHRKAKLGRTLAVTLAPLLVGACTGEIAGPGVGVGGAAIAVLGPVTGEGALKGNQHLRAEGENLSKVLFSIAKMMGTTLSSLGDSAGKVTSGLSVLEA